MLNKKDIIRINQEIGENGSFSNESSLDFALHIIKERKSWLYEIAYLTRCLLVDHVFTDGNKRTTFVLIITYFELKDVNYDKENILNIIDKISSKNIKDINKIMRLVKSGIIH